MAGSTLDSAPAHRLASLDGLRGVAAAIVMLYHFTRRYGEHFDAAWHPLFSYDGQFGVLLFFMISGYVITLTTQRVKRPGDFLYFRISRLYPTYWVCLVVTTLLMWIAQMPRPLPTPLSLMVNLTMLTKTIRRLPHTPNDLAYIDGAYWSLEIELFFYAVIFALLSIKQMHRVLALAVVMNVIGAVDHWLVLAGHAGVASPVRWLLFFEYWPYFGIGIALFAMRNHRRFVWPTVLIVLALLRASERGVAGLLHMAEPARVAVDLPAPTNPWVDLLKVVLCVALFAAAVFDRFPALRWRVVVAVGAISYPLYLLHQNIGYIVIYTAHRVLHLGPNASIAIGVAVAIILATVVSLFVERPSMHWLRRLYVGWTHRRAVVSPISGMAAAVPLATADETPLN